MKFKRKYKITIEDESHLTEVASTRFSRPMIWLLVAVFMALCLVISGLLIAFTPMRTLLPGYLKANQRSATEEGLMRLDSLMTAYEVNQKYLRNYFTVTDTERIPGDSAAVEPTVRDLDSDSLQGASVQEQRFVSKMEERERYNISVLAPLAADGMIFSPVTTDGVFTSASRESTEAVVSLPADEGVQCAADGTVIALYHSPAFKGYVIVVHHNRGFVTSYAGVGTPLVGDGDNVNAGQMLAMSPAADSKGQRLMTLRLWHNGHPLRPYEYLGDPGRRQGSTGVPFDFPRGMD